MIADSLLKQKIQQSYVGATPGICLQAYVGGKKKIDIKVGDVYPLYDLASLTKVICTTSLTMKLVQGRQVNIQDSISKYLSWAPEGVSLHQLLTHSAGFPWWLPIHKDIPLDIGEVEKKIWLKRFLRDLKTESREKAVYSDVDFWFLGLLVEEIEQQPLDSIFGHFAEALNLKKTGFHPGNHPRHPLTQYAPTEECPWRQKLIQGEVHDENAWALGGVAGHAGLFGSIDDVSRWGLEVRKGLYGESKVFSEKVVKLFTKRAIPSSVGDWSLGFMMPTPGGSSSGRYFSPESFGHTGFVGTSFWFDPKKDFMVVILSNRVYPTRTNEKFKALRPQLHDWCFEACFGG